MKLKALITMLVLGSSSAAMARPAVVVSGHAEVTWKTTSHDHPPLPPNDRPAPRPWGNPAPVWYPDGAGSATPVGHPDAAGSTNTRVAGDASSYIGPIFALRASYDGRDDRYGRSWRRSPLVPLTQPTRIDRGREFFTLGPSAGAFTKIALQPNAGRTYVTQVAIEFAGGGRTQVIPVNEYLRDTFVIDLDRRNPRTINRIVVYGTSGPRASYSLLGG
jgi:hypothetical protein